MRDALPGVRPIGAAMTEAMLAESYRRAERYETQAREAASRAAAESAASAMIIDNLRRAVDQVVALPLDRESIIIARDALARLQTGVWKIEEGLSHVGRVSEIARGFLVQAEAREAELRVLAEARDVSSPQIESAR